jgi:hypothetical protein
VITVTTTDVRTGAIEALAGRIFSTGVGAAELCTAMLDLARRAGYADGQILPIEHPVWRFHRPAP